jgi:ferredoxin
MTIFYFTATGNSLSVAKHLGGTLISIPQVINSDNLHYSDDAIGIVFPIYWWNLPLMVRQFIEKVKFETDYLFAIGTYGSLSGAAMSKLQNQSKHNFVYANQLLMLDNYLPVFDMNVQEKNLPKKNIDTKLAKIVADINNRKYLNARAHIGKRIMTAVFERVFNPRKHSRNFIINSKCNMCGVCKKVCPAQNISVSIEIQFSDRCEGCLACIHLCPQNAMHHKREKNNERWRNPEVSLSEIMDANSIENEKGME